MANGSDFSNPERQMLPAFLLLLTMVFLAGFASAVAGVAKLDKECDSNGCKEAFRPQWWSLAFELATYIFMFGSMLAGVVDHVRIAVVTFLVLTAANTEDLAETYIRLKDAIKPYEDDTHEGFVRAALAGFILLTFSNFVFILLWGIDAFMVRAAQCKGIFLQQWQDFEHPPPQHEQLLQPVAPNEAMPMSPSKSDALHIGDTAPVPGSAPT